MLEKSTTEIVLPEALKCSKLAKLNIHKIDLAVLDCFPNGFLGLY